MKVGVMLLMETKWGGGDAYFLPEDLSLILKKDQVRSFFLHISNIVRMSQKLTDPVLSNGF